MGTSQYKALAEDQRGQARIGVRFFPATPSAAKGLLWAVFVTLRSQPGGGGSQPLSGGLKLPLNSNKLPPHISGLKPRFSVSGNQCSSFLSVAMIQHSDQKAS